MQRDRSGVVEQAANQLHELGFGRRCDGVRRKHVDAPGVEG